MARIIDPNAYQKHGALTPAAELRTILDQLEGQIGKLGHNAKEEALQIPRLFDRATRIEKTLEAKDVPLSSEKVRLETALAQFKRKGAVFLREIGGVRALREARQAATPDPDDWWWFIDRLLAEQRRAQMQRIGRGALIGTAVLLILAFVYSKFLAPDPATVARLEHQQAAENLASSGDWAGALNEAEQGLSFAPDDPELLILEGAIERNLGDIQTAEEAFSRAEQVSSSKEAFLVTRAQVYLRLNQPEDALADAKTIVALNPDSATGYLTMGMANEATGNLQEAAVNYQKSGELANASGEAEIAAIARFQLSQILMRIPLPTPS